HRGRLDQAATRRFIAGLPDAAATDAIVELRQPVSSPRVLLDRWGVVQNCRAGYVEPPFAGRARALSPRAASGDPSPLRDATVSWHCLDPGGFSSWADSLAARDDAVLSALRLPTRPVLRSLSQDGMVYGFYLQSLAKAQLQSLLADPQVAAVTPVVSALAVPVGAFAP
ncbi:MAG: hypothetical protein QOK42_1148, partial [Frankiaceae bacterium]|nr:hypothetical protein [Frankiaceae bacterium]